MLLVKICPFGVALFFAWFVPFCGYYGFSLNLCVFAALREIFLRVFFALFVILCCYS